MSRTRRRHGALVGALLLAGAVGAAQDLGPSPGLVVESAGAPAAKAGIAVDDRLLTYDDKTLSSPAALQALQENTFGKSPIVLRVRRGPETRTLLVPPGVLGVEVRPDLSAAALRSYEEGRSALHEKQTQSVIAAWTSAAKEAQAAGTPVAAAWLHWRLGMIHESQRQAKEAQAAYGASWAIVAKDGDAAFQSLVLSGVGRALRSLNDFPAAAQALARASEVDTAAGYELWAARDLTSMASLAFTRGHLETALEYETRSLAIKMRLVPDSVDVASSLNGLGAINRSRGDLTAAHEYTSQALSLRERLVPDSVDVAGSLNNLGLVAHDRGDPVAASRYHTRALEIRERREPGSANLASSLNNLGLVAESRGDLTEAEAYYNRALEIHGRLSPDSLDVAQDLNNLGNVAGARGDLQEARTYYGRALAIKRRLADGTMTVASTLKNLGLIASMSGDHAAAREYHGQAIAIEKVQAPDSLPYATSLDDLGRAVLGSGDFVTAQAHFVEALEIEQRLAPNSLSAAATLHDLGVVASRRGDLIGAHEYFNRALGSRERQSPGSLIVAETLTAMGDLALRERRLPDARSLFSRAVAIVETHRSAITSTDARALLMARHSDLYSGLLQTDLALGDSAAAFATLERARARSLVELLAERGLDFRAEAPAALIAEQDALDQQRSAASGAIAKAQTALENGRAERSRLDATSEAERIRALEQSVQQLLKRLDQLQEDLSRSVAQQRNLDARIRQASPRLAALRYPEPLDLARSQAALDNGTLLLAYFVAEDKTYLFAITKTGLQVFTLSINRVGLSEQVNRYREIVARKRLGSPAELGSQLYETLVRPAEDWVQRATRVLVCPDGPLDVLPFAALVSRTAPAVRYFFEDKPLHSTSSMTVYAETRRWAAEQATQQTPSPSGALKTVLAFGDPIYSREQTASPPRTASPRSAGPNPTPEVEAASLRRDGLRLTPLPHTREEVMGIANVFGKLATTRLGREATETAAKREAKAANILHFASHAWMDPAMGLSSGLALSQPDALGMPSTAEDDGLLQAWEIFEHVRLNADLVVLSACETGLGQDLRGEGLIGLTRAFLYAGARSMVVSLWDVSDVGASEFMKAFYREIRAGTSKDVALQRAMSVVARNPAYRHPFYWSPFVLAGDWR